jgi:predicted AAA+ superfamily ATPase
VIARLELAARVRTALGRSPVTVLVGPRQCGKTTLAAMVGAGRPAVTRFDLERPADLAALAHPAEALGPHRGLVIVDEVQRRPDLFPVLRVLADRRPRPARFLLLGSASPDLLRQGSESLAGRVEIIEMQGFDLSEVGAGAAQRLWIRGGFPPSFLARSGEASLTWRENFIQTFLERDLPQFGLSLPPLTLRRFWTMVAHYHGRTWNASEIGRSLGVSDVTTRRYLDILTGAYMIRQLPPWFENVSKRQVRAPRVYVRDSGLLHALLGVDSHRTMLGHPKLGASWEGFALEEVLRILRPREAYFWGIHGQAELDLLVLQRGRRLGFEFKFADAPDLTRSMQTALRDLRLDALTVVYPGDREYTLAPGISVTPLARIRSGRAAPGDYVEERRELFRDLTLDDALARARKKSRRRTTVAGTSRNQPR